MKSNWLRAALACAVLAIMGTAALAANNPIPGVDIVVKKHPGGNSLTATTDANGQVVLKGLEPGDYEVDIDGTSFVAAMDGLAPPPEKKESHSSFSVGIGGMFGGSRRSSSGQGAGPAQGGGTSHGGSSGGVGLGVSIPVPGSGDQRGEGTWSGNWHDNGDFLIEIGWDRHDASGNIFFSADTPLCRDGAKQGTRIGFTVPESSGGPVTVVLGIKANTPIITKDVE